MLALLAARLEAELHRMRELGGALGKRPGSVPEVASWETVTQRLAELEGLRADQLKWATQEGSNAEEWERRATLAVRAGDDDLAGAALANRRFHLEKAQDLRARAKHIEDVLRELRLGIDEIRRANE